MPLNIDFILRLLAAMKSTPILTEPKRTLLLDFIRAALLFSLLLLFYQRALHGGLLFDDDRHLTPQSLRSFAGLWRIWFEPGAAFQYYPVLHSFYWVEQSLWQDWLPGYHWTSLLLHLGSALLLVALMRRLALPGAWIAAFIFALHPVSVESVAWISEQKNTLSTFFYLASALVYLRFDRSRNRGTYFTATLLFLLALLSKTVTATLPGALWVIFWWQRGRLDCRKDALPLLPWWITGAAGGLFSGWMERHLYHATGGVFTLTFPQHLLLAAQEILFYIGKLLWPVNLMFHYPIWKISLSDGWLHLIGLMALLGFFGWIARWNRGPLAALLFFVGTLFPVLGFFNIAWFNLSYVADHFAYLASLGVIVPVSVGLGVALRQSWLIRGPAVLCVISLVLVLCGLTWKHCPVFSDMELLYRDTLERNPDSSMAHFNYGLVLIKMRNRLPEALSEFRTALELRSNDEEMNVCVAKILLDTRQNPEEAIAHLEAALRINPKNPDALALLELARKLRIQD